MTDRNHAAQLAIVMHMSRQESGSSAGPDHVTLQALIKWLIKSDNVTQHALITWLSCTDHVTAHALMMWLLRH